MKNILFTVLFILSTNKPSILFASDGFGGNAIGGINGTFITVTNTADLITYATSSSPYIITVSDTINLVDNLYIASNKTIQGADSNATINGNLRIGSGVRNVIVQYLNITNPNGVGGGDGITITDCKDVFINHCTFTDCADGSIDIIKQADSVTVSWCRFRYLKQASHCYVNLIGHSDLASYSIEYLHVTIHHCWFDTNCVERMPSVRFGRVHVYNNYYNADSTKYCVRTRLYAECLVENNYFENVKNPWELLTTTGTTGKLYASNNNVAFGDTSYGVSWISNWYPGQSLITGNDTVFTPSYSYNPDATEDVKVNVVNYAGNKENMTGLNDSPFELSDLALYQNYPNPFNPSTKISYSIPQSDFISLKIYNTIGQEIQTLMNKFQVAGKYKINFDAQNLSSGIYFYKLQVGSSFVQTKKMILMR